MTALRLRDDLGRELRFAAPPERVVSLVPSDTFSVAALGCAGVLVGRTDYCVEPPEIARVPALGGTKNPRLADVLDLAPDLVLANREENTRRDLEALAGRGVRVWVSHPRRVADGIAHLARLARVFGVGARELLRESYDASARAEPARVRAFCPIWLDPLMTVHADTFVSDAMRHAGAENVFADRRRRYPLAADLGEAAALPPEKTAGKDDRYPRVGWDEVLARRPDVALLPDEPYAFGEAHAALFRARGVPAVLVSGKDLCWYGAWSARGLPRLADAVRSCRP